MEIRRLTLILFTEVELRHNYVQQLAKEQPKHGKAGCRMKLFYVSPVLHRLRKVKLTPFSLDFFPLFIDSIEEHGISRC